MNENSLNEAEQETITDAEATGEDGGHWNSLAELLGAEAPPEEPPQAAAEPPKPVTPPARRERKEKAAEPPPRSHWQTLAGMLGIGSGKIADEEVSEPDEESEFSEVSAESPAAAPTVSHSPAPAETAEETTKPSFWGRRGAKRAQPVSAKGAAEGTSPEEAEEVDGSGTGFGFGVVDSSASFDEETSSSTAQHLNEQLGGDFEPDEAEIRQAESKSVLETLFTPSDESFWEEVDDDEDAVDEDAVDDDAVDEDAVDEDAVDDDFEPDALTAQDEAGEADDAEETDERTDRDRGRRRSRRSQQDRTDSERSQTAPTDGARSRTDDDDEEPEESRGGRPRRRRRRRGSRSRDGVSAEHSSGREADEVDYDVDADADDEASVIDADAQTGPSDSVLRMEASADLFDEPEQAAEPPRRRGQAKRREGTSGEDGGRRKPSIPSWEEAVGVIVQSNLDSRSESGSNGNTRRRRSGRRRKPDHRPRSDS